MNPTTNINAARVLLGGLVAGCIIFTVTGIVNGVILNSELENWVQGMGSLLHPPVRSMSMSLWMVMCLLYGVGGVFIYAGIRPRYGAGPKAALLAGLLLWVVSKLAMALDLIALGVLPGRIIAGQLIGGLAAIMSGVFFGAWLYNE
jgi:hypothetical protein